VTDSGNSQPARCGVLLVNLGTPDAPTPAALRKYLAEFLADPRVVEMPRWLWWLVLHGVILRIRPRRSARAYARVWSSDGSPLLSNSRALQQALQTALAGSDDAPRVELAMRYGNPSIADTVERLLADGVDRLLVVPLYPQYSATTSASVFDGLASCLAGVRNVPELQHVRSYHDDPAYLHALAESVQTHWQTAGRSELLIFSFHGIPQRYVDAGDPYADECEATARAVASLLELDDAQWRLCFQSRFGREPWLQPYLDVTLEKLAAGGLRNVTVICPGFAADCLETLEEIDMENRQRFLAAGGETFHYIPALNASPAHVDALRHLVERHLLVWKNQPSP
jgi:ferrochelatase